VVGLYVGYDKPQPLGKGVTGGGLSAPIFKEFMAEAMKGVKPVEFKVPEGMKLIAINRKTGMQATPGAAGSILEAFKPGTGPADSYWVIGAQYWIAYGLFRDPHCCFHLVLLARTGAVFLGSLIWKRTPKRRAFWSKAVFGDEFRVAVGWR
jgi:hypothetical protein